MKTELHSQKFQGQDAINNENIQSKSGACGESRVRSAKKNRHAHPRILPFKKFEGKKIGNEGKNKKENIKYSRKIYNEKTKR